MFAAVAGGGLGGVLRATLFAFKAKNKFALEAHHNKLCIEFADCAVVMRFGIHREIASQVGTARGHDLACCFQKWNKAIRRFQKNNRARPFTVHKDKLKIVRSEIEIQNCEQNKSKKPPTPGDDSDVVIGGGNDDMDHVNERPKRPVRKPGYLNSFDCRRIVCDCRNMETKRRGPGKKPKKQYYCRTCLKSYRDRRDMRRHEETAYHRAKVVGMDTPPRSRQGVISSEKNRSRRNPTRTRRVLTVRLVRCLTPTSADVASDQSDAHEPDNMIEVPGDLPTEMSLVQDVIPLPFVRETLIEAGIADDLTVRPSIEVDALSPRVVTSEESILSALPSEDERWIDAYLQGSRENSVCLSVNDFHETSFSLTSEAETEATSIVQAPVPDSVGERFAVTPTSTNITIDVLF